MAWIESHQEIGKHPKTRKAARLAGTSVPAMVGHLHLIWHWALDFAQEGDVSQYEPWQVEDAAMWDGDEGVLFTALRDSGFINDDCALHDWHEYAGKLIERRRADSERKRRESPKKTQESDQMQDDIQRNSDGTPPEDITESIRNLNRNPNRTNLNTNTDQNAPDGAGACDSSGDQNDDPGKPKRPQVKYPADFEEFWRSYPSGHGNKGRSYDQWRRIRPDAELHAEIMAGIERWKQSDRWQRGFVKAAEVWLKDAWWANDPPGITPIREVPGEEAWRLRTAQF